MINAIRIDGLRGIQTGSVEELTPLSVLVGPNGACKSTVLDALMLAASSAPGDAVGRVVQRRVELWGGARWLFWRGGRFERPHARVSIDVEGAASRSLSLSLLPDVSKANDAKLRSKRAREPYLQVESILSSGNAKLTADTALAYDNTYVFQQDGARELKEGGLVRLVDPRPGGMHAPLWKSFSEAVEGGLVGDVEALVKDVLPELDRLLIVSNDAGLSVVHLGFADYSIPVGIAGDGIQTFVQVCLAVARRPGSTVLLEEPEATQHPRTIHHSARAIVAAVQRGVQVILSTHSLDLVDMLRTHLGDEGLTKLSVHNLACTDGKLSVVRYGGAEVALARDSIGEDLR